MNCSSPTGQGYLRQCALSLTQHRIHLSTNTFSRAMEQTQKCDIEEKNAQLKEAAVGKGTLGRYSKNFRFWESFCNDFGFPVWIDELPRVQQARMVGLFAGLCVSERRNKSRTGNKLNYRGPEFELIAQGYKRSISQMERKQPVTAPMLLEMRRRLEPLDEQRCFLWGSIVLAFFCLDRSSELWGPVSMDNSTGNSRTHCVKTHNVILRNRQGYQVANLGSTDVHSVEMLFESHKGDYNAQGVTHHVLCPILAAQVWLKTRERWTRVGVALGPYLTSTSRRGTTVSKLIKDAAKSLGQPPKDYSCHSLRSRGVCALLAAGKSDLVIRLMGRWSSWCFTVYTRLQPGMIQDAARSMITSSIWEHNETNHDALEGELQRA
ncbi:hypothetical protein PHMEG_00015310 [Phytophthora megakarya]|uniref:Tyr recombinase domain-containing protein n=1 Tax=Phytophthora megakarya TaxID=4795 RepID=A0A225W1S5_9STRA|nr:hypothetical protein PHMEG_00015310 [Phytophthora megakarya]